MLQSLILIDSLSSACWEKKKERNFWGPFFLGLEAGHALLAMLQGIFVAVKGQLKADLRINL
jgi:hypothetical protein